jgi:phage shock protein A
MVSGEYEKSKEELERLQRRLQSVENQCETFMRNGNEEHALIKAEERQEIIEDIARVGDMMEKYKAAVAEAKEISSMCEQQLQATKKEMRDTIQSMQDNKRLTEVYQSMDKLRTSTGTDKMISAIKEKNENLSKMAAGSKAVYRNSMAAKTAAVEKDARRMESNAYLESLRNKYSNNALENKGTSVTVGSYKPVKKPDYDKR